MSIRAGVIGVGLLGERYCYALKRNQAVQLKAIADTSKVTALVVTAGVRLHDCRTIREASPGWPWIWKKG